MQAGLLTEKIQILKPINTTNEYGEDVTTYERDRCIRANVVYNRLSKELENSEWLYNGLVQFEIRNYHYVEEFERVCYNCNHYNIIRIESYPKQNKKVLYCERVNE